MLLLWHCLTAALPTVNCLHVFTDRARQKQQAAILENEGFSWQVRALAAEIHGGHLLHWQEVTDCVCLPRLLLCLFQVTPDLEVLSPSREREKVAVYRPAYKEPLWWPVAADRGSATSPVQACHQQTNTSLSSPLTEHRQMYVTYALLCRVLCSDYRALMSPESRDEDFTGICNKNELKAIGRKSC